jgi:coenzyme F420-reducing hydrogenase beta subunit
MEICKKEQCCGCFACLHTCPVNAISYHQDTEGFIYPSINDQKCIKCQRCINVCPANKSLIIDKKMEQKVYACWTKDSITRQQSTSGGIFTELAKFIIIQNGIVYGAAFDEECNVHHIGISTIEEITKLQGSKYVQSNLGNVYRDIVNGLEMDKYVLFSGTPCQVAGLRSYLQKNYDKLYTCDLVCHGVPTPSFYNAYKDNMIKKYKSNITGVNFRYKKPGWKEYSMRLDFANGRKYICSVFKDKYHRAFLDNFIERESCHGCKYACSDRVGDITLADFWGYTASKPEYKDDDKGISQIIINTEKGLGLFSEIEDTLVYDGKTLAEAINGNPCLSHSFLENPQRGDFWKDYYVKGFKYVSKRYLKTLKYGKWWYLCIKNVRKAKTDFRILLSKVKKSLIANLL